MAAVDARLPRSRATTSGTLRISLQVSANAGNIAFAPQLDADGYWPASLILLGAVLIVLSIRRTPGPGAP